MKTIVGSFNANKNIVCSPEFMYKLRNSNTVYYVTLGVEMEEDAVHFPPPQSITGCSCYDIGPRGRGRREEAIIWMFDQALKIICQKNSIVIVTSLF